MDTRFGTLLRAVRIEKNLSQSKLAKMTDLTQEAISNYEKLSRDPSIENKRKLLNALEIINETEDKETEDLNRYIQLFIQNKIINLQIENELLKRENKLLKELIEKKDDKQ